MVMVKDFGVELKKVYNGDFKIYSADNFQNSFILACGNDGVHIIDNNTYRFLERIETVGAAFDAKAHGYRIYVAEGIGGVEIFEVYGIAYRKIITFNPGKDIVSVEINDDGRYMKCICKDGTAVYADISNEADIVEAEVSDSLFRTELVPCIKLMEEYPGICYVNMYVFVSCDCESGVVSMVDINTNKLIAQFCPEAKPIRPVLFGKRNLLLTEDGYYEILFHELVVAASQL